MKQILIWLSITLIALSSKAQQSLPGLFITTQKTTSVVFPSAIRHIDRGSRDILVQQVNEAENILLIKASLQKFTETNLSVITADGKLYAFDVAYDSMPKQWVYYIAEQRAEKDIANASAINDIKFENELLPSAGIETYANGIIDNPKRLYGVWDEKWGIRASLNGIYIKGEIQFNQLKFENSSAIDYDIDFIKLYIRDQKKSKRTAIQEQEILPLSVTGNQTKVAAGQQNVIVMSLQKFTIPDAKYLAIEIREKNGGRNLLLKVRNNKIINAKQLPDLK